MCKSLLLITTTFAAMATSQNVWGIDVKVILMGGQSNMVGRAPTSGLPVELQGPQNDVLYFSGWNTDTGTTLGPLVPDGRDPDEFGMEVTFGRTMADAFPDTQFALIKYSTGATNLHVDWAPDTGSGDGYYYSQFQQTVTNGLAALSNAGYIPEIVGMLWQQGESDAAKGEYDNYDTNLTNFIGDIRDNYGTNLPFMIGQIRHRTDRPDGLDDRTKIVIDAQEAVGNADPYATFVSTSDLTFLDDWHFDAPSMITLGERHANLFIENHGSVIVPEPSAIVLLSGLALLGLWRTCLGRSVGACGIKCFPPTIRTLGPVRSAVFGDP